MKGKNKIEKKIGKKIEQKRFKNNENREMIDNKAISSHTWKKIEKNT